jgi:hypothetical protein
MLAAIRPDSWNFPLFLHVFGAIALFGGTASVAALGFAAQRRRDHAGVLARVGAWSWVFVVVPGWILMRAGAQWILSKEYPDSDKAPGWVDVGFIVSEPGAILLLVLGSLLWLSARRQGAGRAGAVMPWLAAIYVLALGAAMFAMSAKP